MLVSQADCRGRFLVRRLPDFPGAKDGLSGPDRERERENKTESMSLLAVLAHGTSGNVAGKDGLRSWDLEQLASRPKVCTRPEADKSN